MLYIPVPLAVALRVLFQAHKTNCNKRSVERASVFADSEPIYACQLIKLKMKLLKMGKNLKNWEADNFGSENVHVNIEDKKHWHALLENGWIT